MANTKDKTEQYVQLAKQAENLIGTERDLVANMANISALLFNNLEDINWAGFYIFKDESLVLGPFQGKPACIRISLGKGVCGTAALNRTTQIIPDVMQFEGHIACDSESRSEIVLPILSGRRLIGVLDIDSPSLSRFCAMDGLGLQNIVDILQLSIE